MTISDEWVEWTRSKLKRGTAITKIREGLKNEGFVEKDIKYALKKTLAKSAYKQNVQSAAVKKKRWGLDPSTDYHSLAHPTLTRNADGKSVISLGSAELQLFVIPNFLDVEQCNTLIEIIRTNAHLSRVDGYQRLSDIRSSRTCSLAVHDHPFVAEVNHAISRTLGLSLRWSEVSQGQWYEPGQQYKPHLDYFPPGSPEHAQFVSAQGQRSWTFMVYLNKTEHGGGTHFTQLNKTLIPEQGLAVCWNNLRESGEPNPFSEHAGLPVETGSKYIITKWFRDRGEGSPFTQ
ncbi:prolyl hydroxylase family protein [Congregibacter sp.]|jgi:prolyl 4-hydroxylase|uniref:prolyl hydroxylase family protein n=1 Tax=Congregibacter sp. TaxID=2744308 RepID=UPI0039E3CEDB